MHLHSVTSCLQVNGLKGLIGSQCICLANEDEEVLSLLGQARTAGDQQHSAELLMCRKEDGWCWKPAPTVMCFNDFVATHLNS